MKYVYSFTLYIYIITQRVFTRKDVGHTVSNQRFEGDTINVVYTQHAIMVCINNMTFGLVLKWAIPQISAFGSGTW